MTDGKIEVLVAEDSAVSRTFLVHLLESDPQIRVVGAVADGQAALDFLSRSKPDVVLMDIYMPGIDGFETTRRIMETQPLPIVICSAVADPNELDVTFRTLQAGAIACIKKPVGREHADFAATATNLLQTVKLMSEVKVVRRSARPRPQAPPVVASMELQRARAEIKVIGIGASTGGPPVLQAILARLPKDFPAPVLVVQHIAHGFVAGMAEWLNHTSGLPVCLGGYGVSPQPGHIYLAPDDCHMGMGTAGQIVLSKTAAENCLRPAVSFLFRSLAESCGSNALGVLLTGMGKDGAAELKLMKDKGAVTIAQDRESSVVHGMPGEAIGLGGATHVLPADKISDALITLVKNRNGIS